VSRQVQTCKEIKKSPLNKKETKLKKLPTKEQEVLDQNIQMTYFWFSCKCQTKNNLILKNKKKIEKFAKNHMYKKKTTFSLLPSPCYPRSTSNQKTDTRKIMKLLWNSTNNLQVNVVESFCVFFSFFLTLPNIREKKFKKKYENQHFINKKKR